jgi:hypothetical protein
MTATFTRVGARVDRLLSGTRALPVSHDDGGRERAGLPTVRRQGDCVVRAIAIATLTPYAVVREQLSRRIAAELVDFLPRRVEDALAHGDDVADLLPRFFAVDYGVARAAYEPHLLELGWRWEPLMGIGTGCRYHLAVGELPSTCIAVASRHVVAVMAGRVRDIGDPTRNGTRCVYGVYHPPGF